MYLQSQNPKVSVEQRASNDVIKRIRKLRWIGMDEEARQIQRTLRSISSADVVLAVPCDTD